MKVQLMLCGLMLCVCFVTIASAQDAVKVDPTHYSVLSENDRVRILKVHYGAHEKSVMHSHPDTVVVFLTAGKGVFHLPDGTTKDFDYKAGQAEYGPAGTHLPENTSGTAMDAIVIEMKGHAGMGMKSEMKSEMK